MIAMGSCSPAMVYLIKPDIESKRWGDHEVNEKLLVASIRGDNSETFHHFLLTLRPRFRYSTILHEIINSHSKEFCANWESSVDIDHEFWKKQLGVGGKDDSIALRYTNEYILKTALGNFENAKFILSIWKKLELPKTLDQAALGRTLIKVAHTCYSIELAEYLIEAGAAPDYRRHDQESTPLHHAAKQDTPEAAGLIKYLLGKGADPTVERKSRREIKGREHVPVNRIRDEVGAKGISKWLGVSWDDLVSQMQPHRTAAKVTDDANETL